MDMQERLELKNKYASFPDEEIINMLLEGKDSYVEEAYELLLSEARGRGIEGKLEEIVNVKDDVITDEEKKEPETFVQIMVVNNENDLMFLKTALEEAGTLHFFQDLSLRGDRLPVSLMVAESHLDMARVLFKGFKPSGSIILW